MEFSAEEDEEEESSIIKGESMCVTRDNRRELKQQRGKEVHSLYVKNTPSSPAIAEGSPILSS